MKKRETQDQNLQIKRLDLPTKGLLAAMASLFEQGQLPHHQSFPELFGPGDNRDAIIGYLKGFLKPWRPFRKRNYFAFGWYVDERLAGYLLYRLHQSNDIFYGKARWTCYVEDVVVDHEARGLGGASALMQAVLAEIEPLENCVISGTVWNGNDASVALFKKHGFESMSQSFYKVKS